MPGKPRILLVEDHHNSRVALAYELQLAGYQVSEAPDGETALELLEAETFALVLTDIVLGAINGIEVMHTARLQPYRPAVILLTGYASLDTAIAAIKYGATAYLLKPCATEELLTSVEQAVRRHTAEQKLREAAIILAGQMPEPMLPDIEPYQVPLKRTPPRKTIVVGNLVVGSTRQQVSFKGHPLNVTPIEYALLRCLANTPGLSHPYSDIVRSTHRLDMTEVEAQALLRPHIRNLRKKLSSDAIVTERGTGYMLVDPDAH